MAETTTNNHIVAKSPLLFYTQAIPEKLIDLMVDQLDQMDQSEDNFKPAGVGGSQDWYDNKIRNTKVGWWYENNWACSVISHYIFAANKSYWEYDLNFLQSLQVSVYDVSSHYNWHSDYGTSKDSNMTRKLSASILITNPSEYEGGDLEFVDYHNNLVKAPKEKGTIVVFDSRVPHRVTPITKGKRVSLVAWMLGPKLR